MLSHRYALYEYVKRPVHAIRLFTMLCGTVLYGFVVPDSAAVNSFITHAERGRTPKYGCIKEARDQQLVNLRTERKNNIILCRGYPGMSPHLYFGLLPTL